MIVMLASFVQRVFFEMFVHEYPVMWKKYVLRWDLVYVLRCICDDMYFNNF